MTVEVDLTIYPLDVVLRACHRFTGRCYVGPRMIGDSRIAVDFVSRDAADQLDDLRDRFANELLDTQLRAVVAAETRAIRELLFAQAFCEADLLDRADIEADEAADPRGIAS